MHLDSIIVCVYLMMTLLKGLRLRYTVKTIQDYSVADKNFSTPVMVATLAATLIGAENILTMSQRVFESGIIYIVVCFAMPLCLIIIAKTTVPKMIRYQNMLSVGDIMDSLYGRIGRVITGLAGFLLCMGYVGAQVAAIGYFFNFFFGVSAFLGIVLGAGIVTIYSALGGIRAVARTDVIQFLFIVISIPIVVNVTLNIIGHYSIGGMLKAVPKTHLSLMPHDKSIMHYIGLFIILAFPFLDPAIIQRMLMTHDVRRLGRAFRMTAGLYLVFCIFVGAIGLNCLAIIPHVPSNEIIPHLVNAILPEGVRGFTVAGVLAIIMSTADSYLNAGSICFTHDFIKPILGDRMDEKDELLIARWVTVFMGIGSIVAAISKQNIMDIVLMFCNFWGPIITIPLWSGILGYKATTRAFVCSALAGILTCLLWLFYLEAKLGFDGLIPSILANALVFFLVDRGKLKSLKTSFYEASLTKPLDTTEMQAAMRSE